MHGAKGAASSNWTSAATRSQVVAPTACGGSSPRPGGVRLHALRVLPEEAIGDQRRRVGRRRLGVRCKWLIVISSSVREDAARELLDAGRTLRLLLLPQRKAAARASDLLSSAAPHCRQQAPQKAAPLRRKFRREVRSPGGYERVRGGWVEGVGGGEVQRVVERHVASRGRRGGHHPAALPSNYKRRTARGAVCGDALPWARARVVQGRTLRCSRHSLMRCSLFLAALPRLEAWGSARCRLGIRNTCPPPPSPGPPGSGTCVDSCRFASDGDCDDGGAGAEFHACQPCTDCTDCGSRVNCVFGNHTDRPPRPPHPHWSRPPPPPPVLPAAARA